MPRPATPDDLDPSELQQLERHTIAYMMANSQPGPLAQLYQRKEPISNDALLALLPCTIAGAAAKLGRNTGEVRAALCTLLRSERVKIGERVRIDGKLVAMWVLR